MIKRVLLNCSNLHKGGGVQVGNSIILQFEKLNNLTTFVIASKSIVKSLDQVVLKNVKLIEYNQAPNLFGLLFGVNRVLSNIEKEFKPDFVFSVFGPQYWRPKSKHLCGFAKGQFVFTDSPFFKNQDFLLKIKNKLKAFILLRNFYITSDCFVSENEEASRVIGLLWPDKNVYTVSNTCNQVFFDFNLNRVEPDYDKVFNILTVSANYPHKNLGIIPSVIEEFESRKLNFKINFTITINSSDLEITDHHKDFIKFLGPVSIQDCPRLYEYADAVFLPTLLECFSANYCEGMLMKRPVLTSNLMFAKAICGDAAIYFDPLDPVDICDKIIELKTNPTLFKEIVAKGVKQFKKFETPETRVNKYIQIMNNETNNPKP